MTDQVGARADEPAEMELEAIAALLTSALMQEGGWRDRARWLFDRGIRIRDAGVSLVDEAQDIAAVQATKEPNIAALEELISKYGSESFDAGAWSNEDDEPYEAVAMRCSELWRDIRVALRGSNVPDDGAVHAPEPTSSPSTDPERA